MNIHVKLFAAARQHGGGDAIAVDLPAGATVSDLRTALVAACPDLSSLLPTSMIAIDHDYANDSDVIPPSAEVALIPPVSGG